MPDIASLTPESDFTPFMRRGVDAVQRNAALKKLFTDPHFNVMDGLDIYIDDYSRPDPIPPEVLRQLVQSDVLGLFRPLHGSDGPGEQKLDGATGQLRSELDAGELPGVSDSDEDEDRQTVEVDLAAPVAAGEGETDTVEQVVDGRPSSATDLPTAASAVPTPTEPASDSTSGHRA